MLTRTKAHLLVLATSAASAIAVLAAVALPSVAHARDQNACSYANCADTPCCQGSAWTPTGNQTTVLCTVNDVPNTKTKHYEYKPTEFPNGSSCWNSGYGLN